MVIPVIPPEYNLIFEDHFDNPILNRTIWTPYLNYSIQDSNIIFGGSNLQGGLIQNIGELDPMFIWNFKYGYIEFSAKLASSTNNGFTSFLTLVNSPYGDIHDTNLTETSSGPFSLKGDQLGINKINLSTFWDIYFGQIEYSHITDLDLSADYHIYGIEWTNDFLKFYFDNNIIYQITKDMNTVIPDVPLCIRMGLCTIDKGGSFRGCYPSNQSLEFPIENAKMYVDYVRVYQTCTPPDCQFRIN